MSNKLDLEIFGKFAVNRIDVVGKLKVLKRKSRGPLPLPPPPTAEWSPHTLLILLSGRFECL